MLLKKFKLLKRKMNLLFKMKEMKKIIRNKMLRIMKKKGKEEMKIKMRKIIVEAKRKIKKRERMKKFYYIKINILLFKYLS